MKGKLEGQSEKRTFRLAVDFVTREFVEWIDEVAKENGMSRDSLIRYVLRRWLHENYQNKKIFVDAKIHRLLKARALEKGTTVSHTIEFLLTTRK